MSFHVCGSIAILSFKLMFRVLVSTDSLSVPNSIELTKMKCPITL